MQTQPTIEPAGSPSSILAKLLSSLRGDRYMRDAYPPAWHAAAVDRDGGEAAPSPASHATER
jgi:hypothetical protein